jgi:hypothetical protein
MVCPVGHQFRTIYIEEKSPVSDLNRIDPSVAPKGNDSETTRIEEKHFESCAGAVPNEIPSQHLIPSASREQPYSPVPALAARNGLGGLHRAAF